MDLSGQGTIKTLWAVDTTTGLLTLTFKNGAENLTLGTLVLEGSRFSSMIKALEEMGTIYFPDASKDTRSRTFLDVASNKGSTVFE